MRVKSGNSFLRRNHSKTFNRGISLIPRPKFPVIKNLGQNSYLILSNQYGRISAEEIEITRRILRRLTAKHLDTIFVRIYPFIALTKKPTQARMGRGKGGRSGDLVAYVKPGKVLFEIKTKRRKPNLLKTIYLKISSRISVDTTFIRKKDLLFS
jgi:large subunit ribosomal protein L16